MPEGVRVRTIARRRMAQTIAEAETRRQSIHHRIRPVRLFLVTALNLSRTHYTHPVEFATARQCAIKAPDRARIGMAIGGWNFGRTPWPRIDRADPERPRWIVDRFHRY